MNIIICKDCFKYIKNKKIKNLLKPNDINPLYYYNNYNHIYPFTKCLTCSRYLEDLINIPYLFEYISKKLNENISIEHLLYLISRYSFFNHNKNINYINQDFKNFFNFNTNSIQNINKVLKDLNGIPPENEINEKINYLM